MTAASYLFIFLNPIYKRRIPEDRNPENGGPTTTTPDLQGRRHESVRIEDLRKHPKNPKIHSQEQILKIATSIKDNGWGKDILITADNTIIAGHATVEAAKTIGMEEVPATVLEDISPDRALALLIADNRMADLAENDTEALAAALMELRDVIDIEATGYTEDDLQEFMPDGEQDAEDDGYDAPEEYQAIDEPVTQAGDVWLMGEHRIMCGDSTDQRQVARLMNGRTAKMAFTDPPYNVDYNQDKSPMGKPKGVAADTKIMNDKMGRPEFGRFLDLIIKRLFEAVDGVFYICMSCKEWPRVMAAFEENGGHWSSTIIWNKSSFVLSRKDYHPKFEPILYGWKEPDEGKTPDYTPILYGWVEGSTPQHLESRSKSDIWEIKKPTKNVEHPTMKPIELVGEAINNSSDLGDLVVDLFSGSGTTVIAAEQLGRVCYTMEMDPKYCDVTVHRWEEHTGRTAERIPAADAPVGSFTAEDTDAEEAA